MYILYIQFLCNILFILKKYHLKESLTFCVFFMYIQKQESPKDWTFEVSKVSLLIRHSKLTLLRFTCQIDL